MDPPPGRGPATATCSRNFTARPNLSIDPNDALALVLDLSRCHSSIQSVALPHDCPVRRPPLGPGGPASPLHLAFRLSSREPRAHDRPARRRSPRHWISTVDRAPSARCSPLSSDLAESETKWRWRFPPPRHGRTSARGLPRWGRYQERPDRVRTDDRVPRASRRSVRSRNVVLYPAPTMPSGFSPSCWIRF